MCDLRNWDHLLLISVCSAGGLQAGIGAGMVMATLSFAYSYARVNITAFSVVQSRSGCVRTYSQRASLEVFSGRAIAVALSGYLFFGSAINVCQKVLQVSEASEAPLASMPVRAPCHHAVQDECPAIQFSL